MNVERLEQAVKALKRLHPHKGRYAYYKPSIKKYTITNHAPTDALFARHFMGEALIGAVSGDQDGNTTSVGIDLDGHVSDQQPVSPAKRFIRAVQAWGVPVLVHASKSGSGFHIRTLFKEPVPQYMARAFYLYLAAAAKIDESSAFDKVWPPSEGCGVLALPLQVNWMKKTGGTVALDPNTLKPYDLSEQVNVVLENEALSYMDLCSLMRAMDIRTHADAKAIAGARTNKPTSYSTMGHRDGTDGGLVHMVKNCLAVQRLEDEATTIHYEFWFAMMTNFKPFLGGREIFEAYCQLDRKRYKPRDLAQSWRAISGGPRMCANLDPGWRCPNLGKCGCKSPASMPFWLQKSGKLK